MFEFCRNQYFDIFVCKGWRRREGGRRRRKRRRR
jgi:hypothetical protein